MFTIEQIKAAHSKVKSGADFPAYIKEIKALGVSRYETFIDNGRTDYYGAEGFTATSPAKYETLAIADQTNAESFKTDLKAHQQGQSDYPVFCNQSAQHGIYKWEVRMDKMTCTYFDKAGNEVLVEQIPQ